MNISKQDFEEKVINNKEECIVDFYAEWCGPCQMMMPVMEKVAEKHRVYKVNTDDETNLALSFGIMSIPCFIVFKDGKEYKRHVGMASKSEIDELFN